MLSSTNLKELYSNLNKLANEYSYSYLNKQFELFFGVKIDKNAFRSIQLNENYLKSWLVNGFTYKLKSYFCKIKNQYKKEKELVFDFRFVFAELLKRELLNSYKTYLESCIDDSKEFKLDGTSNLFLSSNNSIRHKLKHVLKSCGITSNFSKDEKREIANIISEILNE